MFPVKITSLMIMPGPHYLRHVFKNSCPTYTQVMCVHNLHQPQPGHKRHQVGEGYCEVLDLAGMLTSWRSLVLPVCLGSSHSCNRCSRYLFDSQPVIHSTLEKSSPLNLKMHLIQQKSNTLLHIPKAPPQVISVPKCQEKQDSNQVLYPK